MTLINQHILMSDAKNFSVDQPINPYYADKTADKEIAQNEHSTVKKLLEQSGIKVTQAPSPISCQDGVYTANWALVRGDKAVLANLPNARCDEMSYAEKILTDLGKKVMRLPEDLKFSGQGDALACGNLLFCGSGYRSDAKAQAIAADVLGYERIQLHTLPELDTSGNPVINAASLWPDSFFYDIDLALSILRAPTSSQPGLIAYCEEAFDQPSREKLCNLKNIETITVSKQEATQAFATNLVSTGETVIMSANAPELAANLRSRGFQVLQPEITELAKGGGYIRCITLSLD